MRAPGFRSSGDLAADRRYLWGEGARGEGDYAGAADLFRQAVELCPVWATGWFALGRAAMEAGKLEEAREALERCLDLEPEDELGASVLLSRLTGALREMPIAYVAGVFDEYADRFDGHLTGALRYRGPEVICDALARSCKRLGRRFFFDQALDLGCGTGLMARALGDAAGRIDGVDLSARMLEKARATGLYDELAQGDAVGQLRGSSVPFDLILAADVLVYLGDLAPLFVAAAGRMHSDGLFAFTTQRLDGEGYALGADMRFSHAPRYVIETAAGAGLAPVLIEDVSTRRDAGRDVPGLVAVLRRVR